jgi:hypothetical protein
VPETPPGACSQPTELIRGAEREKYSAKKTCFLTIPRANIQEATFALCEFLSQYPVVVQSDFAKAVSNPAQVLHRRDEDL